MRHCSRLHVKSCPQPPWPPLTSERDPVAVWLAGCGPAGCDNHYLQCRVIGPAFRPAFKWFPQIIQSQGNVSWSFFVFVFSFFLLFFFFAEEKRDKFPCLYPQFCVFAFLVWPYPFSQWKFHSVGCGLYCTPDPIGCKGKNIQNGCMDECMVYLYKFRMKTRCKIETLGGKGKWSINK